MSDIKIVIGAEVAAAESGLKKVQAQLANTAVAATKADSAMVKLKGGSNQATFALTNLGRVIQDAPYGIIGITNNINPLLESFQRLKVETGSTKEAFKSLASGLVGAGGIGLAVSAATSILSVLALNGFFRTGEEAEKASKKVKTFGDFLRQATDEVAREQTEVLGLIGVLKSENETRDRKLSAIKELQNIQPEIFKNLKLEQGAVIGLDTAYKAYVANLQNVITAKILQSQLEEKISRQLELQKILASTQGTFNKPLKDFSATSLEAAKAQKELADQLFKTQKIFGTNITGQQTSLELNKLTNEIDGLSKKLFELSKTIKLPEITVAAEKIKIEPPKDPRFYVNSLRNLFKDIEDKEFTSKIVVNVQPQFKTDPAGINKAAIDLADQVNAIVKSVFVDAFSGLGEAIGDALSGVSIDGAFSGIVKSLAGGLKAIGQKIIEANVQLAIFKKIGFSNPVVGIAVGVAITALGAALQNAVSKQKAFATGVRNFGGGTALVGERGPEMVYLPKGSSVQPNNELNAYGGGQMVFIPDITLRGTDLVIAFNRASDAMGRNN